MNQPSIDLTRRSFFRASAMTGGAVLGAGGLASLLSACGGSDASTATASTSGLTAADISAATGKIDVMTFSIFQAPALSSGAVTSSFTTIESTADIIAKLRSQDFKPGIVDSGQNSMPELYALERLVPIQTDLLPVFADLDPDLVSNPAFAKDGEIYAIPFSVATCMTEWDSEKVPEPTSAEQLLGSDYRNGIALTNTSDTLLYVHHALGGDLSSFTRADLDDVLAYLDELKPNVKTFNTWQDVELLGGGEVTVLFTGSSSMLESTRAANPAVKANFLGAMTYADCWCIADTADPATAHAWLDSALGEKAQQAVMKLSGGFPSLGSAADPSLFPQELRELTVSEVIEKAPLVPGVVAEPDGDLVTRTELEDAWTTYQGSF
jgi:putative spermidine/putrescine transport system substrate-binding protein